MTFSIDSGVKDELERAVPKSKRSGFVEGLIAQGLKDAARQEALRFLRELKPYPAKGPDTVETLRRVRTERAAHLAERHAPAKK